MTFRWAWPSCIYSTKRLGSHVNFTFTRTPGMVLGTAPTQTTQPLNGHYVSANGWSIVNCLLTQIDRFVEVFALHKFGRFHRARAQSAVTDGARARNRKPFVHDYFLISATLLVTMLHLYSPQHWQFPSSQRVDDHGKRQSFHPSSTSSVSLSRRTSTNSGGNRTVHRRSRSAARIKETFWVATR